MAELSLLMFFTIIVSNGLPADDKLPQLHHRSNLLMPDSMLIPESLLFEVTESNHKKVICKTCHDIEDIQDRGFDKVDKQQDNFLRAGPYEKLTEFCYLCHDKKKNNRENIHILLDADAEKDKQMKEHQCLYCHTEVLKQEDKNQEILNNKELNNKENDVTDKRKSNLKLRLPEEKICYGCHLQTPHLNALEHQVEITDEILSHLKKSRQLYGVSLPLGKNDRITCVTCHDPHQQGVLKTQYRDKHLRVGTDLQQGVSYEQHPWTEVYAADKKERLQRLNQQTGQKTVLQYQRIKNEVLLRLPAKNGMLCIACHDFTQERLW